jgi:hypothetical protein
LTPAKETIEISQLLAYRLKVAGIFLMLGEENERKN